MSIRWVLELGKSGALSATERGCGPCFPAMVRSAARRARVPAKRSYPSRNRARALRIVRLPSSMSLQRLLVRSVWRRRPRFNIAIGLGPSRQSSCGDTILPVASPDLQAHPGMILRAKAVPTLPLVPWPPVSPHRIGGHLFLLEIIQRDSSPKTRPRFVAHSSTSSGGFGAYKGYPTHLASANNRDKFPPTLGRYGDVGGAV